MKQRQKGGVVKYRSVRYIFYVVVKFIKLRFIIRIKLVLELREYIYDTACAFRKTHVVDGNRLKYEGFEALSLSVNS